MYEKYVISTLVCTLDVLYHMNSIMIDYFCMTQLLDAIVLYHSIASSIATIVARLELHSLFMVGRPLGTICEVVRAM